MFRHLKKKRIFIPIIILIILIGIFTVPKGPDKITIIEVEDGKPTIERELVFFDVDPNEPAKEEITDKKAQEIIHPETTKKETTLKEIIPEIVETDPLKETEIIVEQEDTIDSSIEIKLTGILFDKTDSSAIIEIDGNDYVVKVGDRVGKFDILGITQKRIYLKDSQQEYTLTIGEVVFLSVLLEEGAQC